MRKKGNETVLVVDDEISMLQLIEDILSPLGYQLLCASNGNEALRLAAGADKVDLLLTDVVMPDMRGQELAALFQSQYPDTKVLFMSAYMKPSGTIPLTPNQEGAFLQKPFTRSRLTRKLRALLR